MTIFMISLILIPINVDFLILFVPDKLLLRSVNLSMKNHEVKKIVQTISITGRHLRVSV